MTYNLYITTRANIAFKSPKRGTDNRSGPLSTSWPWSTEASNSELPRASWVKNVWL